MWCAFSMIYKGVFMRTHGMDSQPKRPVNFLMVAGLVYIACAVVAVVVYLIK